MVTSVFFAKYPHSIGINAGFIVTKKGEAVTFGDSPVLYFA